jgi:hypothetical protein
MVVGVIDNSIGHDIKKPFSVIEYIQSAQQVMG